MLYIIPNGLSLDAVDRIFNEIFIGDPTVETGAPGQPPAGGFGDDYRPEEALVLVLDKNNYKVLGVSGRYLEEAIQAGAEPEELGFVDVPDAHGYYVFTDGEVLDNSDQSLGSPWELHGDWFTATAQDFVDFGVPMPDFLFDAIDHAAVRALLEVRNLVEEKRQHAVALTDVEDRETRGTGFTRRFLAEEIINHIDEVLR